MPINFVLVDTNIWHFTYVKPKEQDFVKIHDLATKFLSKVLSDNTIKITITNYQIAEIIELLRKNQVEVEKRRRLLNDFKKDKFLNKDFKEVADVENPLYPWILREGKKPIKIE